MTILLSFTYVLLILYCIGTVEAGIFTSSLDKIKKKAKEVYAKKLGKSKNLDTMGHPKNEYPGSNKKYKNENREKWQLYYDCLNKQKQSLGSQKTETPEAILGFEGSFIKMDCKICLSPAQSDNMESVTWEWADPDRKALVPIEFTEHIFVAPEDKSLRIYNLDSSSTGQYRCRLGQTVTAPYFLTVVNMSDSSIREVHNMKAPIGPYPKDPENFGANLVLDTEWGEWSSCSKCNGIGKKHKFGYCEILLKNAPVENTNNVYQEPQNRTKRNEKNYGDLFKIFKFGIPCQSHILPATLCQNPQIAGRKNEIMSGFCNIKCLSEKIFEIRDKHGKIIEIANNSAGIYSLTQVLPPLEPPVERKLQYEEKDKDIVLICPGNLNSDVPIQWQIGDKNLIPEIISKESNGRIYISITDRVHINKARLTDSNIYSCWQGELAGTIRLVVEKKFKLNFNHTIMLIGIVIVTGTFLYVFIKVIEQNRHMKNRE